MNHLGGTLEQTVEPVKQPAGWHGRNRASTPHIMQLVRTLRTHTGRKTGATYLFVRAAGRDASFEMLILPDAHRLLLALWWRSAPRFVAARWSHLTGSAGSAQEYALQTSSVRNLPRILVAAGGGRIKLAYTGNRMLVLVPSPPLQSGRQALAQLLQGRVVLSLPRAPSPTPTPHPTGISSTSVPIAPSPTAGSSNASTPTAGATFVIAGDGVWKPMSVSIRPGAEITWINEDARSAHPVQCVTGPGTDPCPWTGILALPAGGSATVTFFRSGIFEFEDAVHPSSRGTVVVGAPK